MSYFERKEKQIEMQRKMCVGTRQPKAETNTDY